MNVDIIKTFVMKLSMRTYNFSLNSNLIKTVHKLIKICIIEVYLLSINLKATSYINDVIIDKQSLIL